MGGSKTHYEVLGVPLFVKNFVQNRKKFDFPQASIDLAVCKRQYDKWLMQNLQVLDHTFEHPLPPGAKCGDLMMNGELREAFSQIYDALAWNAWVAGHKPPETHFN